jgi:hypothetical protein
VPSFVDLVVSFATFTSNAMALNFDLASASDTGYSIEHGTSGLSFTQASILSEVPTVLIPISIDSASSFPSNVELPKLSDITGQSVCVSQTPFNLEEPVDLCTIDEWSKSFEGSIQEWKRNLSKESSVKLEAAMEMENQRLKRMSYEDLLKTARYIHQLSTLCQMTGAQTRNEIEQLRGQVEATSRKILENAAWNGMHNLACSINQLGLSVSIMMILLLLVLTHIRNFKEGAN